MTNCYEDTTGIWRNKSFPEQLYTQYCESLEVNKKIIKLIVLHGSCFDDDWQYKFRNKGKIVVRYPLWAMDRMPVEHAHKHGKDLKHPYNGALTDYIRKM